MYSAVESILAAVEVGGEAVPYAHIRYTKTANLYITYQFLNETPELCADDLPECSAVELDVDIYSKSRVKLAAAKTSVLTAFLGAGWSWIDLSPEMYEDDTGFIHRTFTFENERMI